MSKENIFNSATAELMRSIPNLKWDRYPDDVIPMWIAAPDVPIAPEIMKALHDSVDEMDMYYNADKSTREVLAGKINEFNKIPVDTDDVMLIQGVDPSIWLGVKYACKPGDEVIVNDPTYHAFTAVLPAAEAKPVSWVLDREDGYKFDSEALKEIITPRTKLIYLCNPHNPAGRVMTKEELKAVADIAVDGKITIMVDELWEDIVFKGNKHVSIASLNPEISDLTLSSWGFSKTFGVAGLQIGYMATTNKEMLESMQKAATGVQRGTSTLGRAAARVMVSNEMDYWRKGMMDHLHKTRAICSKRLGSIPGVEFPMLEGTYVPFPKFDLGLTSDELQEYILKEARVAISSGKGDGEKGKGHMRINIATSESLMNEAMDRVVEALSKL
ncbi:aminotransferase class I/II-fold pyridoxal phosphate-dependent enzyme [Candidatus Bathyarchaeota archaeon]|nr:aminotransferase class I/II-fold pyridoxal phosphate-dependent enzyme [Candidatus Bathyarchaeota archaeon]